MADPLRHDEPTSAAEGRDTRIEELLLAGLDHYFNGQHELAINVWTRVLFLDRSHARARAYIERARGAVAERQREGEELLQTGMAAFQRGDADDARRLLTSAVDRGASPDEAMALLDRLDRLASPARVTGGRHARRVWRPATVPGGARRGGSSMMTLVLVLAIGLAAGASVMIYIDASGLSWRTDALRGTSARPAVTSAEPLPIPAAAEFALARARALQSAGRLRDALDVLDAVRPADPLRAQADDLRAAIQSQLLTLAHASRSVTAAPPGTGSK